MRKTICAIIIACQLLGAGSVFAAFTAAANGIVPAGNILEAQNSDASYTLQAFAKLSTGVSLGFKTSTTTYAITTKHQSGDKIFGAAANDGKNYANPAVVGDSSTEPTASDSVAFSGWSTL